MLLSRLTLLAPIAGFLIGLVAAPYATPPRTDAPKTFTPSGFTFEVSVNVQGTPEEVFDAFTGDVTAWWDHHLSEKPKKIFIEPKPGGGFYEIFDDAGNGVQHARVTLASRGKALRLVGPLGLGGMGVDMEQTLTFTADGAETKVKLVAHGIGRVEPNIPAAVQGVWKHFLVEQFEPYVKSGKHKQR